jgi:hypothetical protein
MGAARVGGARILLFDTSRVEIPLRAIGEDGCRRASATRHTVGEVSESRCGWNVVGIAYANGDSDRGGVPCSGRSEAGLFRAVESTITFAPVFTRE